MLKRNIITEAIEKIGIKKALTVLFVTLAVLFPTVLAIFSIIHTNNEIIVSSPDSSQVVLLDSEGNELFREDASSEPDGSDSLLEIFKAVYSNMEKSDPPSEGVQTETPLTASMKLDGKDISLICHFSFTEGSSFCVDSDGQYYRISAADSERFLASEFSQCLYVEATPPELSTTDGDSILPLSAKWNYKNINDSFVSADTVTNQSPKTYSITGGISLSFSDMPDYCRVRVYQFGQKIFDGSFDELPFVTVDSGNILNITVRAVWSNSGDGRNYGELNYDFNVIIRKRADLSLNTSLLAPGQFAVLKVTNVTDTSMLLFSSEQSDFSPDFYLDGETACALIPYPSDVEGNTYEFTVSYGVATKTFTIEEDSEAVPTREQIVAASAAFGVNFKQSLLKRNDYNFLTGAFTSPEERGYTVISDFGSPCEYGYEEYSLIYTQYACVDGYGMSVVACYGGSVVYAGENSVLGKYAIVDVGLGLKIWYCNLGAVDVKAGDIVASGEIIGKSGTLTFDGGEGFGLMVSAYDTPISVNAVIGNTIDTK